MSNYVLELEFDKLYAGREEKKTFQRVIDKYDAFDAGCENKITTLFINSDDVIKRYQLEKDLKNIEIKYFGE